MPFLIFIVAGLAVLPFVMIVSRLRAEVVVIFAVGVIGAILLHRLSLALLVNVLGWLTTLVSFLPGFAPGRWLRRRPKVKV